MCGSVKTSARAISAAAGGTHPVGGVSMALDSAEMRFYAVLGAGLAILALCLFMGVSVDQILMILAAFGLGGALPSPLK